MDRLIKEVENYLQAGKNYKSSEEGLIEATKRNENCFDRKMEEAEKVLIEMGKDVSVYVFVKGSYYKITKDVTSVIHMENIKVIS